MCNVLLQVLDDGRLTDGQGRTVDFKNTVIILTSNVGTRTRGGDRRRPDDDDATTACARCGPWCSTKCSARSGPSSSIGSTRWSSSNGSTVPSSPRSSTSSRSGSRGGSRDGAIELDVSQAAREQMGELGWDPQYGARPLKRAIQRYIEDPLAERILKGEFGPGDTVVVDRNADGVLTFERKMLN